MSSQARRCARRDLLRLSGSPDWDSQSGSLHPTFTGSVSTRY
jgi:hypothetical protein